MTDSLTIFGTTYTGVTGIIATDTNDTDKTYIRPQGTKSISANGTGIDVTNYASVDVAVPSSAPTLQTKSVSITPSETAQSQTVTPDSGYDGLNEVDVSVGAISSTYVGSGITRRNATDGLENVSWSYYTNGTIHYIRHTPKALAGYYETDAQKTFSQSINSITDLPKQAATTITPTTSQQIAVTAAKWTTGDVVVAAMPSGTAGTPTATKGTVSNHSISVTPSVTNTTGYITGGTKTGTAVSVSASELVSGSETKTANGTYDVTNLASLVVAVPLQTIYTGTSAPSSSTGTDGDVYIQTA